MGYFPNGSEATDYEQRYCERCVHQDADERGCPVFGAHLIFEYEECNALLDMLIPVGKQGGNEQCSMFHPKQPSNG